MRPVVRLFAEDVAQCLPVADPVVEIGARAAEGQEREADLRAVFAGREYVGCDMQPGPGVDRIEDVHALTFADASVGTVLCFETLEHVADPLRAVQEMYRVLRPGGVLAMTSLMFFPIHEHPHDYWRFTPGGFDLLLAPFESRLVLAQGWELLPEGLFGVGVKGPFPGLSSEHLPRTAAACHAWGEGQLVDFGPIRMTVRRLWAYTLRYSGAAARVRLTRLRSKSRRED